MVPDSSDFHTSKIGYAKKSLFLYVAHSLKLIHLISFHFWIHDIKERGIALLFKVLGRWNVAGRVWNWSTLKLRLRVDDGEELRSRT